MYKSNKNTNNFVFKTHKSKEVSLFVDLKLIFCIIVYNPPSFIAFDARVAFSTERCKNI